MKRRENKKKSTALAEKTEVLEERNSSSQIVEGAPSSTYTQRQPTSNITSMKSKVRNDSKCGAQKQKAPPMMTINSTNTSGGVYDDRPFQHPQGHATFNSQYDESDGSDGSIVFSNRRKQGRPGSQGPERGRERFPSFDSMADSGSVVRHAAPHTGNSLPSPTAAKVTPQNLAKVNPQMLPYDQRRKLMKWKQQQQKPHRDRSPAQSPHHDGRNMQYIGPPSGFQSNPYHSNGLTLAGPPSPQSYGYALQHMPVHMSMNPHVPMGGLPPPQNARLSPYRSATPPRFEPTRPAPQATRQGGRNRQYPPPPQRQQKIPQYTPIASQQHMANPKGATMDLLVHSSSIDSSVQDFPPARHHSVDNNNDSTLPAPPPPPPPEVPPHHVRAESTGSVSSLGSQGSVFGYYGSEEEINRPDQLIQEENRGQGGSAKHYLLQMLNPFAKKTQVTTPQEAASEFHRQNQHFLKQSGGRGPRQLSSKARQHHRVAFVDRPPASRLTHKRLPSIDNDNWDDPGRHHVGVNRLDLSGHSSEQASATSHVSSSEETDDSAQPAIGVGQEEANERTSLLPPPGQGSSEYRDDGRLHYMRGDSHSSSRRKKKQRNSKKVQREQVENILQERNLDPTWNTATINFWLSAGSNQMKRSSQRKQKKRKHRRRSRKGRNGGPDDRSQSSNASGRQSSSSSSYDYRRWSRRRAQMLEDERSKLIAQWRLEARAESLQSRRKKEAYLWHRRLRRYLDTELGEMVTSLVKFLSLLEVFICNIPLSVGAVAMAMVTLGVVWFKFVEELLDTCEPVHFHSSQCTFPEFPGCFYCDTTAPMYKVAIKFHFACSAIAAVLLLCLILKMLLATQVVLDEMSSPTTASPAGLLCMTTVCVAAGRGFLGKILVSLSSIIHLGLVVWFMYMSLAYHTMPDPSWFPNTIGIGMSAVKCWLYYPMSGHLLMAMSLCLNFFFFPISLVRVILNEKISATVAYMIMSAPAISLYALTIMAQPSFEQEKPDINRFQRAHRLIYLPAMHFLFVMSVIGLLASGQSLVYRWKDIRKRDFSPAHAAFCFPMLSHANAVQAYRAAIDSFSNVPQGNPWKIALDVYWVLVLVGGTLITLVITAKFFYNLPKWTDIDVDGEQEPPAPYETTMSIQNVIAIGESLVQPFVSPAVLQANETGALVMVRRSINDGRPSSRLVRTRRIAALGFEPSMSGSEMERECNLLLEWVGKHPPRRRNRTLSVPGIDFSYGPDIGIGSNGAYADKDHPSMQIYPLGARSSVESPSQAAF